MMASLRSFGGSCASAVFEIEFRDRAIHKTDPDLCKQILLGNWCIFCLPLVEYAESLAEGDGLVREQVPDADAGLGMISRVEIIHKMSPKPHMALCSSGEIPKVTLVSDPAAALLVTSTRGEVSQNVVGSLSDGVRTPFLVPRPRLWFNTVFFSQPSSEMGAYNC